MKRRARRRPLHEKVHLSLFWTFFTAVCFVVCFGFTLWLGMKIGEERTRNEYQGLLRDAYDRLGANEHRRNPSGVKRLLERADAGYREDSNLFRKIDSLFEVGRDSMGRDNDILVRPDSQGKTAGEEADTSAMHGGYNGD